MLWQMILESFLLSARSVQILAEFRMTNHFHQFSDSKTFAVRTDSWGRQGQMGGDNNQDETERAALGEIEALQTTHLEIIQQKIQSTDTIESQTGMMRGF